MVDFNFRADDPKFWVWVGMLVVFGVIVLIGYIRWKRNR